MMKNAVSKVMWVGKATVFMVGLAMMVALMIGATSVARPAHAETTITVNTDADENNTDGDCSLREAIIAANTNQAVDACPVGSATGEDSINFDSSVSTVTLGSQLPSITDGAGLIIDGETSGAHVSVSGNDQVRVLYNQAKLILRNLTVTRGHAYTTDQTSDSLNDPNTRGGAVYNASGTLELNNVTLSGNKAWVSGGAIENSGGWLKVTDSTFSGNYADRTQAINHQSRGGAISGGAKVTNTTFTNNEADAGGAIFGSATVLNSTFTNNVALRGGAIINLGSRLEVTNSSFYGNSGGEGSAIYTFEDCNAAPCATKISKSTFANNNSSNYGGAVNHSDGWMKVTTSTFANNTGGGLADGRIGREGSLAVISSTFSRNTGFNIGLIFGDVEIVSTILEKDPDSSSVNCRGGAFTNPFFDGNVWADSGYNISDDDSCGFSATRESLSNTNLLLDPRGLQDNGGPTKTIALQTTSPAIDGVPLHAFGYPKPGGTSMIEGADCDFPDRTQDQRGVDKPQGSACDTGAFEAPPDVTPPEAPTIASPQEGAIFNTHSFTLSGTAEVNSTVELFEGADSKGTTKANLSGEWSIDLSGVSDGSHSYIAKATDKVGNTSNESTARTLSVDTTAPQAPLISSPPQGSYDNDGFFLVLGKAEAGAKVELFEDTTSKGTTTAGSDGRWSFALSGVSEGSHSYKAKATDAAGNTSAESAARTVIVDTIAPTVKRVVPIEDATGISPGANVSAIFSEAMRAASVKSSFKLYKKGSTTALDATVTYDATANKAVLDPNDKLQRGVTYKAVVTTGAKDLVGNALSRQKVWFFTISQ